jgi:hypothetical protein
MEGRQLHHAQIAAATYKPKCGLKPLRDLHGSRLLDGGGSCRFHRSADSCVAV